MATAKQRAWRAKFGRIWGGRKRKTRRSNRIQVAARRTYKRVNSMARRRYRMSRGRGRSGGFMGGITSQKNIIGTLLGAYMGPKVGVSPQIGAAAGSYIYGKQGIKGAAVGYFTAPYLTGILANIPLPGGNNNGW
jgi:hypothetical protein